MYRPYSSTQADFRPLRDVESQLRDITQDFAMFFNTGSFDQSASVFAHDGVLMAPRVEAAHGQKQVERLLRQIGDRYSSLRLQTTRVDHSGDMAMELGLYTVSVRQPDGTQLAEHGNYVRVWRRLGAWLLVADCWSRTGATASDLAA